MSKKVPKYTKYDDTQAGKFNKFLLKKPSYSGQLNISGKTIRKPKDYLKGADMSKPGIGNKLKAKQEKYKKDLTQYGKEVRKANRSFINSRFDNVPDPVKMPKQPEVYKTKKVKGLKVSDYKNESTYSPKKVSLKSQYNKPLKISYSAPDKTKTTSLQKIKRKAKK